MPISEKEHFDALRASDRRAVELLAQMNSARTSNGLVMASVFVAILSLLAAVVSLIPCHRGS